MAPTYPYARYKDRQQVRRWRKKLALIERRGGKCVECGYDSHPAALQFHHPDPLDKDFSIASNLASAMDILEREADKCIILCANCHSIHHSEYCAERIEDVENYARRAPHKPRVRFNGHRVLHAYGSLEDYIEAGGRGTSYTKTKRGAVVLLYAPTLDRAQIMSGVEYSDVIFHDVPSDVVDFLLSLKIEKAAISDDLSESKSSSTSRPSVYKSRLPEL